MMEQIKITLQLSLEGYQVDKVELDKKTGEIQSILYKKEKESDNMINITESNCNYYLSRLQKENEHISHRIDQMIVTGQLDYAAELMEKYESNCDLISKFITFRNNHDCLLEGDPGYGPN